MKQERFQKLRALVFSLFCFVLTSLSVTGDIWSQSTNPNEGNLFRSGVFSQRKPDNKVYVTLYPGFQYRANNLTISTPNGSQVRLQEYDLANTKLFVDAKSREVHLNSIIGVYFLVQNYEFEQTSQTIDLNLGGYLPNNTPSLGSPYQTRDLGTRTTGRITNLLPVIFIGEKGKENFRFGLGMGVSNVRIEGNPDLYDGLGTQVPLSNFANEAPLFNKLDHIGKLALFRNGKLESDPVSLYLLSNLGQPGNLESLGLYQLSKGTLNINSLNPYTLYWLNQLSERSLSAIEIITLANMGKSNLNFRHNYVPSIYSFFEVPVWEIVLRFGYGGPLYYEDGFRFTFRNVDISTYLPIDL